jgi:hypothetical protein
VRDLRPKEVRLHVADAQPAHREGKTWCENVLRWYRLSIRVVERSPRGDQHGATSAFAPLILERRHRRENLLPGLAFGCYARGPRNLAISRRNLYGEDRCPHLALMGKLQEQPVVSYAGEHGMKREMCSGATSGMNV